MYIPEHFVLQDVLHPDIYDRIKKYGDEGFGFLDDRILWTADKLVELYGEIVINTYKDQNLIEDFGYVCDGGKTLERYEMRPSDHQFGMALDLILIDLEMDDLYQIILEGGDVYMLRYITTIKKHKNSLHIGCRGFERSFGLFIDHT